MLSILPLLLSLLHSTPAIDPRPFGVGSYAIEQRIARDANPYVGTRLDFFDGGMLVWNRDGQPYAMMRWNLKADLLTIDDAVLCPLAPIGLYRVGWKERGFTVDKVSDDCAERAASATTMLLVPVKDG